MSNNPEFDRWQERFKAPGYLFGKAPNAFLKSQARLLPKSGTALAIGDGEGRNGVFLAEQGLDVLSVDFSPAAQDKARALARERGVIIAGRAGRRHRLALARGEFDVVAAIFLQFATPPQRANLFAGIKRALKSGGLLLMQGYGVKQLEYKTGGPPDMTRLYTRELLEREFAGFSSLEIAEHDSVINEGSGHAGMSALIDLIGRK